MYVNCQFDPLRVEYSDQLTSKQFKYINLIIYFRGHFWYFSHFKPYINRYKSPAKIASEKLKICLIYFFTCTSRHRACSYWYKQYKATRMFSNFPTQCLQGNWLFQNVGYLLHSILVQNIIMYYPGLYILYIILYYIICMGFFFDRLCVVQYHGMQIRKY